MNIVIFHCHDLGRFLGCYGVPTVRTPHIDRFAAEGFLLERYFCSAPQCSPSRASMFTGRYPHSNGVMGLTHAAFAWDLHPDEQHIAQVLRDRGYRTAALGTVHEARRPVEALGFERRKTNALVAELVDDAIAEIDEALADGRPFYLQAGSVEPHRLRTAGRPGQGFLGDHVSADETLGVTVPAYLVDDDGARTEVAELQGAVHHVDHHFGRLLGHLESRGALEDTCVVFTADHGVALPRAKCSLYEPGLEIPLIVRLPGGPRGARFRDLVSNVDLVPTLLDWAGIPAPEAVQGRSFAGLVRGAAYEPRPEIFGELSYHDYYDPMRSVRTERHKLIVFFSAAPAFMDPTQSWQPRSITRVPADPASAYHPAGAIELYDLETDPFEQVNVAENPAYAAVREDMLARLRRHLVETGDPILQGAITGPMHKRAVALLGVG